ncbi:heme ABC exporter ATP-binding protein CcmA [Roseovarius sp. LXJ103]|uniref:heme ABC exporter ATP-binding protein CcmA n=1 Tax=Roseovarius carneus TaxID=2853164 RepID=UPI000D60AA1F|nr:heme ABC exporter ATP-binding protein CcmA [Roseovarius carneus]MBZ8118637.1 heme ABC exporter ATP-binding protein CcmA [Roseovarius carneus]PWE35678.1 heme ABC exporter ATP-binding protein CcmA [Pelagicola sp. LXJ1103]
MTLTVQDISVARGGIAVLEGISFTLSPGHALVLRGPNGAGKTTLLRTIAGLQPALSGQIAAPEGGLVYAGHADGIKPTLTVAENLAFWAQIFGTFGIDAALAAYELTPLADRAAGALSAGQKRRLGLARLLVTGRPLWVLDEPTVSLDTHATGLFAAAIRAHLAGGGAALMATHIDLRLAETAILDISPFRASAAVLDSFDEAFL